MAKKPRAKPKPTDAERHQRFVETAHEVEASDDSAAFDRAFQRVAGSPAAKAPKTPTQSSD